MALIREGFFYRPDYASWSPTSIPEQLPLDAMMTFAKTANDIVQQQLEGMRNLKKGIYGIDAYLDQDVAKKEELLKSVDEKSKEFANLNLLEGANQQKVQSVIDELAYNPDLAAISSRTKSIRDLYTQYDKALLDKSTSEYNIYPALKSITEANKQYATTKQYNKDIKIDTRLRPYTDLSESAREAIKLVKPSTIANEFVQSGDYIYLRETSGITADRIAASVLSMLGDDGQQQYQLQYNYLKDNSPDQLINKVTGNEMSFSEYVTTHAMNLGKAYESVEQKVTNFQESAQSKHNFEMAKLKYQENAAMKRLQLKIAADSLNLQKLITKQEAAPYTTSSMPAVPTEEYANPLSIYGQMADSKKANDNILMDIVNDIEAKSGIMPGTIHADNVSDLRNLLARAGGSNATIVSIKQELENSENGETFNTAYGDVLATELYKLVKDPARLNAFEAAVANKQTIDANVEDLANANGMTPEVLAETYKYAKYIADRNKYASEGKGFFDGMWRRIVNAVTGFGTPGGTTPEAVIEDIARENYLGESMYIVTSKTQRISTAIEKAKKDGAIPPVIIPQVMYDTEETPRSELNNITKNLKEGVISNLTHNGDAVDVALTADGTEIPLTNATVKDVNLASVGGKPYWLYQVTGKDNVQGTVYVDINELHKSQLKGIIHQRLLEINRSSSTNRHDPTDVASMVNMYQSLEGSYNSYNMVFKTNANLQAAKTTQKRIVGENYLNVAALGQPENISTQQGTVTFRIYMLPNQNVSASSPNFFIATENKAGELIPIKLDNNLQPVGSNSPNGSRYMTLAQATTGIGMLKAINTDVAGQYAVTKTKTNLNVSPADAVNILNTLNSPSDE
jgi:hypothetical protein